MKAEMPPFKNGKHNSESAFTIDRVITPLKSKQLRISTLLIVTQRMRWQSTHRVIWVLGHRAFNPGFTFSIRHPTFCCLQPPFQSPLIEYIIFRARCWTSCCPFSCRMGRLHRCRERRARFRLWNEYGLNHLMENDFQPSISGVDLLPFLRYKHTYCCNISHVAYSYSLSVYII